MFVLFCPIVAAFMLYYNTFHAGFVYDDKRAILSNVDVANSQSSSLKEVFLHDFWGTPLNATGSHGSYRPIVTLSFRWTAQLVGLNQAYWYHFANVLLHCSNTATVTLIAGRLTGRNDGIARYTSGLLFASHPIHCEAVTGIVGRADLICSLFFLAGLFIYADYIRNGRRSSGSLAATLLFVLGAFLAKEYGIMLPIACLLYDLAINGSFLVKVGNRRRRNTTFMESEKKRALFDWIALITWTIALIIFRLWLSDFRMPHFVSADNPTAASPSWITRTLTFLYLPVFNFGLLVWPNWLSFDWSMDAIAPVTSIYDVRNLLTLVFYATLFKAVFKTAIQRNKALSFIILVVPFLPATNLMTYVGFVVAERILYLPSVGFCLLVGTGVQRLIQRCRYQRVVRLINCSICILILTHSWRTVKRNRDWADEEHLYRSGINFNPPKAYANLGVILHESGRLSEAEWYYKQALSHRANMAEVHYNMGNLFQAQKRFKESLEAYDRAIYFRPQLAEAYPQKANVLVKQGRWEEAEQTLLACTQLEDHLQRNPNAHKAAKVSATILMGDLIARKASRANEVETWLIRAKQMAPQNPLVYYQLGEFLSTQSRHTEAADVMLKAVELDPESVAWTVAAAHALHDARRNGEAEIYFRRAINLAPTDISHQVNLGAVLHVQGKFGEAEEVYQKALQLAPNHPLTSANLLRLRHSWTKSIQNQKNDSLTRT